MTRLQPSLSDTLDIWAAAHGPLAPAAAQLLALDVCVQASRMSYLQLGAMIDSLGPTNVVRDASGRWVWHPVSADGPQRSARLGEAVTRTAALLFFALTGQSPDPLASESTLRARIRALRPDLPQGLVDLTTQAIVTAADRQALWTFASALRRELGLEHRRTPLLGLRLVALGGAVAVAVGVSVLAMREDTRPASHGLSAGETSRYDVLMEAAHMEAFVDEHTVAVQTLQAAGKLLQTRVGQDDPRTKWMVAHEAWVRSLAGDAITPDQVLTPLPTFMANALGSDHPYVRASRLMLVAAREARGTAVDRSAQEALARQSASALFEGTAMMPDLLPDRPTPPGVVAHAAPAVPELEGFRRRGDGAFGAPLTSLQRLAAERGGWRLHVVASDSCTVSAVLGAMPRRITVRTTPQPNGAWQVTVDGTRAPVALSAPSAARIGISVGVDATGALTAHVGGHTVSGALDMAAPPAAAPYELSFAGTHPGNDCGVVWLEIPMPAGFAEPVRR
jgi:hypothetical protein